MDMSEPTKNTNVMRTVGLVLCVALVGNLVYIILHLDKASREATAKVIREGEIAREALRDAGLPQDQALAIQTSITQVGLHALRHSIEVKSKLMSFCSVLVCVWAIGFWLRFSAKRRDPENNTS